MTGNDECHIGTEHRTGIFMSLIYAFALPPLLNIFAVPFLLGRERKSAFCFLIVSVAAIASFYIPIGDQNDYFNLLLKWGDPSYVFDDFIDEATLREFNLVHIMLYMFAKIGGSLELFRAMLVTIAAVFCLDIANGIAYSREEDTHDYTSDLMFFSILMAFPLFSVFTGFRYGLATIVYVWGVVRFEREGNAKCLMSSILLTSCIHFSVSLYWLFYLFVKIPFVRRVFSNRWRFALILTGGLVLNFAVSSLFDAIEGGLGDGFIAQWVSYYLSSDAYFNREFLEDITENTRLFYGLYASTLFLQIPFLCFVWADISDKMRNVLHLLAVFICFGVLMSSNVTMLNRITSLSAPFFAVLIGEVLTMKGHDESRCMRNCFVMLCLIICILPIARMKKSWFRSNVKAISYTPSFLCLMNQYDEDWVDDNIEERALIE